MEFHDKKHRTAIWAITPNGAKLAQKLAQKLQNTDIYLSDSLKTVHCSLFTVHCSLKTVLPEVFHQYGGHVFIMSTGIVVRMIAPYIIHKTKDPAVVVMDELGLHAVSLISGHIGGANELTRKAAEISGAVPVITTATDINKVPAIDLIAKEQGLFIENPEAIKHISMALLSGKKIWLHDPFRLIINLPEIQKLIESGDICRETLYSGVDMPGVFIDDIQEDNLPAKTLILRPASLAAGMGCNRNTDMEEMKSLLLETFEKFRLSMNSLKIIASVDIKNDEQGLIALAEDLDIPLTFFNRQSLKEVENIKTPSEMVKKHIGVKSVCEAAAILASNKGKLIAAKHKTRNVTVAVARKLFT